MDVVFHPNQQAYEQEYAKVRAALIGKGSSLNAYLRERGISRQLAYRALRGRTFGKASVELRADILRDVLAGQS